MFGRKSLFAIISVIVALGFCGILHVGYPFVLASEQARTSLEVTQEQRDELDSALKSSDLRAFAIFGAMICVVTGLGFMNGANPVQLATVVGTGIVLGGVSGWMMGLIGYWFHQNLIDSLSDVMVHVVARLFVMFIPIALAVGLVAAVATRNGRNFGSAFGGAVLAAIVAAAGYGVLSGVITPLELVRDIMPAHEVNRVLLFMLAFPAICGLAFRQVWQDSKKAAEPKVAAAQ
jgi:hypothetical protein